MRKILLFLKLFFAKQSNSKQGQLSHVSALKQSNPNVIDQRTAASVEVHLARRATATYPLCLKYLALSLVARPMPTDERKKKIIDLITFLTSWLLEIEKEERFERKKNA